MREREKERKRNNTQNECTKEAMKKYHAHRIDGLQIYISCCMKYNYRLIQDLISFASYIQFRYVFSTDKLWAHCEQYNMEIHRNIRRSSD